MEDDLRAWVERSAGGPIRRAERSPVGGSRQTYLVDVDGPDGATIPLILRLEAGGSFTGTEINVRREAVVYGALAETPVPVPRVWGLAPGGEALLLERLRGTDDLSSLGEDERSAVIDHFADVAASLHSLGVDELDLPGLSRPRTAEDHARLDLEMWDRLAADRVPDPDPLLCYAAPFLHARAPTDVRRTVLVHGDLGPGNFLAHEGRVTGLVDTEFAHVGDPMDDVAWIRLRCEIFGVDADVLLARYSERARLALEPEKLDYYATVVQYRCAVTTSLAVARGGGALGLPPYLVAGQRYLLSLARGLATLASVPGPELDVPDAPDTPRTPWYDRVEEAIRAAARAIDVPELRDQTRFSQILVHHLRAHDRFGGRIEELDRDDLRDTLGLEPGDDVALREVAREAGAAGDESVLGYLVRRTGRRAALWSTVLERRRRGSNR